MRSSTTPTRAAVAGYVRQPQPLAGLSNSATAPRSWRASEPVAQQAHLSTDRSPMRYASRQPASAAFVPAPGRGGCIAAPAPIAGGSFAEKRDAKSTSPERAPLGLETRFRKIVEDQLLCLTQTLDQNLQQRFAELEGRLDHSSLQRRLVELESRVGQEMQLNEAQGKAMEQVGWRAEQAADSLEQVGLKVEQACAMAEQRARQALEAAFLRHRDEFMAVSAKRLQEHFDLLAMQREKLASTLTKIEEHPAKVSEACLAELRHEMASLRSDLNSQIGSGKAAETVSRLHEALREVSKLRSDFEGYVATGAFSARPASFGPGAEQQPPVLEALQQAEQQLAASHHCQGCAVEASEEGVLLAQELRQATASCHQSNETLLRSLSEVEEAKRSMNSELMARSKGQENLDHARLAARETADLLRSALADYRATSKEMASMAVELKSVENQELRGSQHDNSSEVVAAALPQPAQPSPSDGSESAERRTTPRKRPSETTPEGVAAVGLDPGSPLFDREKQKLRVELVRKIITTPEVPDLSPSGESSSAPSCTLSSPERQGQLVEIVRQAILTDSTGLLDAEKAALARRGSGRSSSAPAHRCRAAVAETGRSNLEHEVGSPAAGGNSAGELVDIVKAALARS